MTILSELTLADLDPFGVILFHPFNTRRIQTPQFAQPPEPTAWLFTTLRASSPNATITTLEMIKQSERVNDYLTNHGTRVYLGPLHTTGIQSAR